MAGGEPIHVVIFELESGIDKTGHDFWNVGVTTQGSTTEYSLTELLGNASDQEEFRWYVEDYASNNGSPFEKARGERCHKKIQDLGHLLYFKLGFSSLNIPQDSNLILDIVAKSGESSLFKIPWEVLEHRQLFPHTSSTSVRRRFTDAGTGSPKTVHRNVLNILLVTARPKAGQDIDYLLISEEVVTVATKIENSKLPVYIEIVRPGTWAAFKTRLEKAKRDGNAFDIVHLDLHGLVIEDEKYKGAYLTFLHQDGKKALHRNASEVGKVCQDNGVTTVIMNACKSAYSSSPASSAKANIAALLIASGIEMVVGMSFTISQGAAKKFVRSLYSNFLETKLSFAEATSMARLQLSLDRSRNARFGMKVDVDDWVVPTLYLRDSIVYEKAGDQGDIRTLDSVQNLGTSAQDFRNRLRQMLQKGLEIHLDIVGRGLDVLGLETALLLPHRPPQGRTLKRNIIHLTGWPGVGKTALLLYLSRWWKGTHFVADAVYCDLERLSSFQAILFRIHSALFGRGGSDMTEDNVREELRQKRYLLIVDHVDAFDSTNASALNELEHLSKFVQSLWEGQSFILVSSRNLDNQSIIPVAWPFPLAPLNPHASVQFVKSKLALSTYENQYNISTREESEALVSLVELCEFLPDCIGVVADYLIQKSILPTTMLRLQRTGELPSSKIRMATRLGKTIRKFLSSLPGKGKESKHLLSIILGIAPFIKRVPLDFENCYLFAKWKGCEGTRDDFRFRLAEHQILVLRSLSNSELASLKWVQDDLGQRDIQSEVSQAIEILRARNFIWKEDVALSSGQNLHYWHIHPLFTFALRQVVATYYASATSPVTQKLLRGLYWGLAEFYNRRVVDFEDTDLESVAVSRRKLLLELENITNSLDVWLQMDDSSHSSSNILLRLSKTINLATLPKQEFKKILDVMQRTSEHYQGNFLPRVDPKTNPIHSKNQLENFLQATEVLQNMAQTTEDWTSAREYASLLEKVLLSNKTLLDQSTYAQAQLGQAKMVLGYEALERGFITKAKSIFTHNLQEKEPANPEPGIRFAYAKLRCMNSLGILKCAFQEPPDHPKLLMDLFVQFEKYSLEWHTASDSLHFNKGWTDDDRRILVLVEQMKSVLHSVQKYYFEKPTEDQISEFIQNSMSDFMEDFHIRQGALRTMYQSIIEGKIWESANKVTPALLAGLTEAYSDEVDDSGLSRYHKELVGSAIQNDDFETALETLEAWRNVRRDKGLPDEHTQTFQDYLYAVCYNSLERYQEAKIHCDKALAICVKIGADKICLACLHIAAQIDLIGDVDFGMAVTHLCQAGCLAYSKDNDCQYQKQGSLLKILAFVFSIALGLFDEEDYPGTLRSKDVQDFFAAAIHGQKQGSKPSSTFNRNIPAKPSQILQYMFEKVRNQVGLPRFINFMTKYNERVLEAMREGDDSQWAKMEASLFGTEKDVMAIPGATTKQTVLEIQPTGQQKVLSKTEGVFQASTLSSNQVPQIFGPEAAQQANQSLNVDNVDPETLLPLVGQVLRIVGAFKDAKQRNFLWHLCSGEQADLSEFRELIPQLSALSIPGFNQETALAFVQYFIKSGADVSVFDINAHTPFMRAVETNNFEIASLLLENGAACDHQDFRFETALHQSVNRQDVGAVKYCISAGCSLSIRDLRGKTPLGCAATKGSFQICRLLLRAGSNPIARDSVGHSCLLNALGAGQYKNFWLCIGTMTRVETEELRDILLDFGHSWSNVIDLLLNAQRGPNSQTLDRLADILVFPDDFTRQDKAGLTSYHRASHKKTPELVRGFFADCGADATIQDDCFGLTPLHVAAISDDPWKMRDAILNGNGPADNNIRDYIGGRTAFDLLSYHGRSMITVNGSRRRLPRKLGFLRRYSQAWAAQVRRRYVRPLPDDDEAWIIEQRQLVAFPPSEEESNSSGRQAMFQSAIMDIGYSMTQPVDAEVVHGGEPANRLRQHDELLQCDIDQVPEEVHDLRASFPWKWNCARWPHVFYLDKGGNCRYTRPLYEVEEKRTCTWVLDKFGVCRGVLGAVDE